MDNPTNEDESKLDDLARQPELRGTGVYAPMAWKQLGSPIGAGYGLGHPGSPPHPRMIRQDDIRRYSLNPHPWRCPHCGK